MDHSMTNIKPTTEYLFQRICLWHEMSGNGPFFVVPIKSGRRMNTWQLINFHAPFRLGAQTGVPKYQHKCLYYFLNFVSFKKLIIIFINPSIFIVFKKFYSCSVKIFITNICIPPIPIYRDRQIGLF